MHGLNEDIGSWKMRAISAPRIARISGPFGGELRQVDHRAVAGRAAGGPPAKLDLALDDPPRPIDDAAESIGR